MLHCFLEKFKRATVATVYVYIAAIVLMATHGNAFVIFRKNSVNCDKCNDEYRSTSTFRSNEKGNTARHWCVAFLSFQRCIKPLEWPCKADLNYQYGKSSIATHIRDYKCDQLNLTTNESTIIYTEQNTPTNLPKCHRLKYKPTYKICGLFGDPHLRTFDNRIHTCSVPGAWPLLANRHLTVQVTNIPLAYNASRATATSKVTVIVKGSKRKCIKAKTYQAKSFSLPAVFSDETTSSDEGVCSTRIHQLEENRVMLDICPLKTKIFIRQVGKYLTVVMRVPSDLMMRKTIGLCQLGCPRIEQMNMDKVPRVNNFIAAYTKDSMRRKVKKQRRKRARKLCRAAKVKGIYYKSCLFDVMTSNDASFVSAAEAAMRDFREINVDDNGRPIVNETLWHLYRPTKRRRLDPVRTEHALPTSSSAVRTSALYTTLYTLLLTLVAVILR